MDYIKIPLYLSGPNASVDRTDTVTIGTAGSYGVHAFEITRGRNWEGLDIKATFYQKPDNSSTTTTPSDEVIQITVVETSDNLVPIPAEILQVETIEPGSEPPETWVTFSGYDGETLKMNSLRLMLEISDTGPSYKTPMSPTPDIEEQLINAVKGYRDEATKAAETAVNAKDEATKQAEDALKSANSAFDSKNAALESEICAAISASKAKDSENEAAVSAENAKASEEKAKEYADNSQAIYDKGIEEVKEYSDLASQKATEAGEYAQDALEYSETALEHRNAAKTSEDNAKTSETNAAKSAEQANQYAGNAQGFMSRAQTYANVASESQIAAASSASKAATSETNAKASRDEAVKAANNALSYQNLAQSYAIQASGSAGAAATSAKNAAESEKNAEARAIESSNYATASQGSAQEAKGYAQQGNTILEQVKQHGAEIESIVAKTPIINETNDLWQLWDKDRQAYVDTDVLAKGQGVAQGGAPGQILVKKSVANYDTEWVDKEDVHTYSIEKQAVADEGFLSTYYLTKDGTQVGTKINIPKDYLVNEANLKEVTETDVPYSGAVIGDLYIDFIVNTKNDDSSDSHIYLPVNQLVDVYTGGNGIDINSSNTISVVIDSNSANGLSVSNTGIKLSLATETSAGAMSANDKIALKNAERDIDAIPIVSDSDVNGNIKINNVESNVYTHPTHTAYGKKLYKIQSDDKGHVTSADEVTKSDITALGIPAQDTTYTDATTTKSGLMSATDKIALNTAVEDIVDIKEDCVSNGVNNVAKGNPAVCEDSVEWPLQGLTLYGKSTQDGTPSPESPVPITNAGANGSIETTITGKNLLTGRLYYGKYSNGIPFIQDENAVSLPYAPNFENWGVCYAVSIRKDVTYTFSVTNGNTNARLFFALYRTFEDAFSDANAISKGENAPKVSITASEDGILVCLIAGMWTNGSTTIHECTESELLQFEIGSTATAYEAPHSQSIAVTTPDGLPGIPVDSGGNFVDADGQEWICNYRDWARGVDVTCVNTIVFDGSSDENIDYSNPGFQTEFVFCFHIPNNFIAFDSKVKSLSNQYILQPEISSTLRLKDGHFFTGSSYFGQRIACRNDALKSVDGMKLFLAQNPLTFVVKAPVSIETPIPSDELAAYRALHAYDGTTIISSPDPLAEIEFNYTTSNQINLPYIKNKGDSVSGTYDFTLAELNVAEPVEDSNPVTKRYLDEKIEEGISQKIKYYIDYDENGMISLMTDDITKTI